MRRVLVLLTVTLAATAVAEVSPSAASAATTTPPLMVAFEELQWTKLPERPGMQYAVLTGDPKSGAYTQIRQVPAGTANPLHTHGSELKNVIVRGVWYTGESDATARDFGPGSVIVMPANWPHVSGCRSGADCVFYQEGKGKFSFHAVEASDSE